MLSITTFATIAQWSGIATLGLGALALLAFVLQWDFRFRLVGVTGFMGVLTVGLFALSLGPVTRTVIPGAVHYVVVYDTGSTQTVIALPPQVTESELEATLRQAASDQFSRGRFSRGEDQLTIRARTIVHPRPGVSEPLVLGQVQRSLSVRDDEQMTISINQDHLARLPQAAA